MTTIQDHLRRYPHARPSTLALIEKRNAKTEQLKSEVAASRRSRRSIVARFIPWLQALKGNANG